MTVGQKIRKLRRERDLTQARLGEKAGIDARNITRYENDKIRPRAKVLQRIADALGVPMEEFEAASTESGAELQIRDPELLQQFQAIDRLNTEVRTAVKRILRAVIIESQLQNLTRSA